jgi:ferredoxin-nitrite reductase
MRLAPDCGFTTEQTSYLSGFVSGVMQGKELAFLGQDAAGRYTHVPEESVHGTPLEDLCKEERIKHEKNGLDCYDAILANAAANAFPEGGDFFRYKFYGLFHVAPAQDSFMLRCRIAGGSLTSAQLRGLAEIARDWGSHRCDITTRANVQIREIQPKHCPDVLMKLSEIGLTSQGAGADNIRNVTASPTSGFDPSELIDVMPLARSMHHYILKNRDLYGLPRKFNIAFDSGGSISVCADTNDIGFYAVKLEENDQGLEPGIYFRMQLCGITGHRQFATDSGVLLTPAETIPVAAALTRVFIENGDRTNRGKARLKYLVDEWGIARLLMETEKKLCFPLRRLPLEACAPALPKVKHGHYGVHRQSDGKYYVGIVTPVGRLPIGQAFTLADIADRFGRGELRLTVWQNLLIPGISEEDLPAVLAAIEACGLSHQANRISGGLIACTGNQGCKYASTDTKGHAMEIRDYLETRIILDQPINIHLTGCPHSCAQHYIGDIGLIGVKTKNASGESVEGYNIVLGGGTDDQQAIAREVWKGIPFPEVLPLLESLITYYYENRSHEESFTAFTRRASLESLQLLRNSKAA